MKKLLLPSLALALTSATVLAENTYEPTWESLDSRETPAWYGEAKFGIFIHWGLYSVPAWAPKGEYAEWYWHSKENESGQRPDRQKATQEWHNRVYGKDVQYKDFRSAFHCSEFDPAHWASVFKQSGAKYVVLTSKHHDGYCLWPSKEATESFGMPWNSVDSGPRRDLVGELTEAVRAEDMKMGLYYSIWDWFNPYWTEFQQQQVTGKAGGDPDADRSGKIEISAEQLAVADAARAKYIHEVMYPQFKEIVTKYEPALLFSDGDWWMGYEKWETLPLLAWLFNNAANADEFIINDRWGQVRKKHGDYFTTEYGSGYDEPGVLWEENRGIGHSFGYNRHETLADYNSRDELIFLFVDIVARGGNFLLDVGPTADGRIPVIMEQRLKEIGDWMAVNSDAIYGTTRWDQHSQWSEGEKPTTERGQYKTGFSVLSITTEPKDEKQAVKVAWFTQKGDDVYALLPQWPADGKLVIEGYNFTDQTSANMLGTDKSVAVSQADGGTQIDLTAITPADLPKSGAPYVVKLTK